MLFHFPSSDSLYLALASGMIPSSLSGQPATVSFDESGHPVVELPTAKGQKTLLTSLKKLGVRSIKEHAGPTQEVLCLPQILPLQRRTSEPAISSSTAVLLELSESRLAPLVEEILRLGNDRLSYRVIPDPAGDRVLLKVIGPPYYSLLQAIDPSWAGGTIVAYLEERPYLWVQFGYLHPISAQIQFPEGQLLLLQAPRQWRALQAGEFQDIYDALRIVLPTQPVEWPESQLKNKLAVSLRLVPGNAADTPEMWVLHEKAIEQLDILVRDAEDRLITRLMFAVAQGPGNEPLIVIRTRPSKLPPPSLEWESARGYKPYWKLPNLFLPVGTRLMPTLRRDLVRKLLADDPEQIVWLNPEAGGKFTPETMPDIAFRPLDQWVDYVIDREHDVLQRWIESTQFDFDSFQFTEETPKDPKPPTDPLRLQSPPSSNRPSGKPPGEAPPKGRAPKSEEPRFQTQEPEVFSITELQVKLQEVESEFIQSSGSLDSPQRRAMWEPMAKLNADLQRQGDALLCWLNIWWQEEGLNREQLWQSLKYESPEADSEPKAAEFRADLANTSPTAHEQRRFILRILYAASLREKSPDWLPLLPAIRESLEKRESSLSVRATWLAWKALVRIKAGPSDILTLARVRDRILNRLLSEGYNAERNLPSFLRFAHEDGGERIRLVRERFGRVLRIVEQWHTGDDKVELNRPYMKLMFAYGLARLGEETAARDLMRDARDLLGNKLQEDRVHSFIYRAFLYRIEAAFQGKKHGGPLPRELLAEIDTLDEGRGNTFSRRYIIDRLRVDHWVIDPEEKQDPYLRWQKYQSDLPQEITRLNSIQEPAKFIEKTSSLLKKHPAPDSRMFLLIAAIPLAPRVGEAYTLELIRQVPDLFVELEQTQAITDKLALIRKEAELLEKAIFYAAHYDNRELVRSLFQQFLELLRRRRLEDRLMMINRVAHECLRGFRKMGLKDEAEQFLQSMSERILEGSTVEEMRNRQDKNWPDILISLLHLADGWLYFNHLERAQPYLQIASQTLFDNATAAKANRLLPLKLVEIVRAYLMALAQIPADTSLPQMEELFRRLEKIPNSQSTNSHYSRLHLLVVEELVRSLISDSFQGSGRLTQYLEDDEYIVRQRLHRDMKQMLIQTEV